MVVKKNFARALYKFAKNQEGQDLVEYALLLAFIALAAVALLSGIKGTVKGFWSTINSSLVSASSAAS